MLRVANFTKCYDDSTAVSDLSFEAGPGVVLGLIGPNGAGKTTTLRALAGVLTPTRGTLEIAGVDLIANPVAAKAQLAYVPDDPPEFYDLTVAEHLAFYASIYGILDADVRADALLEEFQLAHKRDALARDLSRGMRQKLAICCALLHSPRALLFDEPMTGLDPPGIRQLKAAIQRCAAEGAAIVVSSHLLAMVDDICTHILILHQGKAKFSGRHADLRAQFSAGDAASLEEIFFMATGG
ncbi:MAG: ABC transporter ATP-binding protein [Planctomycetales bacterium]|nr:ABC transporter ATP-binding protein [Planctomycetales bacterium]